MEKAADAFRTISEVADELGIQQHVLRFWETKFSQIRPLKRGGGRRYYRPDDVELLRGIRYLLYGQGYTIKGVQRIIKEHGVKAVIAAWLELAPEARARTASGPPAPEAERTALEATSDVSEALFEQVRAFDEPDEEPAEAGAPAEQHNDNGAQAGTRQPYQLRPDVSIMRGGLSTPKGHAPKGAQNPVLPLRSLATGRAPGRASGSNAQSDAKQDATSAPADIALTLTAADRAQLSALMQDLADCRRVLDLAGRPAPAPSS